MPFTPFRKRKRGRAEPITLIGLGFVALTVVWALLSFGAPPPEIRTIEGAVTHVRDGDTIEIGAVVIRIAALDCPELGSHEGTRAASAMRLLVDGKPVACTNLGPDRYGRTLGQCALPDDPLTLSEHMVDGGLCTYWGFRG